MTSFLWFLQYHEQTNIVFLGYFNTRNGTAHQTWEEVIGSAGIGKCNSIGRLLLRNVLSMICWSPIRFSVYQTATKHHKYTLVHLTGYVIVRRKDGQDVWMTNNMCGADCWTDYRLVVSQFNFRIELVRCPQGKKTPKNRDVSNLKQNSKRQASISNICNRLDAV